MTASTSYADAMAAIEAALEVEAAATPGPWRWTHGIDARYMVLTPEDMTFCLRGEGYPDARAIVLARALVRRSLLNAKETLVQHRPHPCDWLECGASDCHQCIHCAVDWPCSDAQRALALVNDIPEGGAK